MSLSAQLKETLYGSGGKPDWTAIDMIRRLEPSRLAQATLADLLFVIDYTLRLCIAVQDEDAAVDDALEGAMVDSFVGLGYEIGQSRRISGYKRLAGLAVQCVLFVRWLEAFHTAHSTHPGLGGDAYDHKDFLSEGLFTFMLSDAATYRQKSDLMHDLAVLLRSHACLMLVDLLASDVPEGISGIDAARVAHDVSTAVAMAADGGAYLLQTISDEAYEGMQDIIFVVRDDFIDAQKREIRTRFGTEVFGQRLIVIDPNTALALGAVELVLATVKVLKGKGEETFEAVAGDLRQMMESNRPCPAALGVSDYSGIADFARYDKDRWPRGIPEVETLVRYHLIAILGNEERTARALSESPPGSWYCFGEGATLVAIRLPDDIALPKARAVEAAVLQSVFNHRALLLWSLLPSSVSDPAGLSFYSKSGVARMMSILSKEIKSTQARARSQEFRRELEIAAGGAVTVSVNMHLLDVVFGEIPMSASAGVASFLNSLLQAWVYRHRSNGGPR